MIVPTQKNKDMYDERKLGLLPIIDPANPSKNFTEKEEKFWREIKSYEFVNIEEPGVFHKFSYGNAKNKVYFSLIPGQKYRLPRFIARHIDSRSTPIWGYKPDGLGSLEKYLKGTKSRFQMRETFE